MLVVPRGPYWTLLAPGLQQQQHLSCGHPGAPTWSHDTGPVDFLKHDGHWDAFGKLAHMPFSSFASEAAAALPARSTPPSRLEALPPELLGAILAELDVDAQIALALCAPALRCPAAHHARAACHRAQAPWAGTPLVCTSTRVADLPAPLRDAVPAGDGPAAARAWNKRALAAFANVARRPALAAQYRAALERHAPALPPHIRAPLARALLPARPPPACWALRNLATRELVRLTITNNTARPDEPHGTAAVRGRPWLTVDYVLTMRICWGPLDPPDRRRARISDAARRRLERGVWAGHRFDVVPDAGPEAGAERCWRDVTDEVVAEAECLRDELSGHRSIIY